MKLTDDGLKILYNTNQTPRGIRDNGGYLLFFPDITKYDGQVERYESEVSQQLKLANFILKKLKKENKISFIRKGIEIWKSKFSKH